MKTDTSEKMIQMAKDKGRLRPCEVGDKLRISQVAVHKQLVKLVKAGKLSRVGKPPWYTTALPHLRK